MKDKARTKRRRISTDLSHSKNTPRQVKVQVRRGKGGLKQGVTELQEYESKTPYTLLTPYTILG